MSLKDTWLTILKEQENVIVPLLGGQIRLAIVDENYIVHYVKDFSINIHQQVIDMNNKFIEMSNNVNETVAISEDLNKIYQIVKEISDHLKLISINALIEAAHAREHGKGFSVVAQEVRKLAEQAAEHMNKVNLIGSTMSQSSSDMVNAIAVLKQYVDNQAAASKDITNAIESVAENTKQLYNQTNSMFGIQ